MLSEYIKLLKSSLVWLLLSGTIAFLWTTLGLAKCPSTAEEWNLWLAVQADHIAGSQMMAFNDALKFRHSWNASFEEELECLNEIPPEYSVCTANFVSATQSIVLTARNQDPYRMMALKIPDEEYFKEAEPFTHRLPHEITAGNEHSKQFSREFVQALQKFSTHSRWPDPESATTPPDLIRILTGINAGKTPEDQWQFLTFQRMPQGNETPSFASLIYIPASSMSVRPSRDLFLLFPTRNGTGELPRHDFATLSRVYDGPLAGRFFIEDLEHNEREFFHFKPRTGSFGNATRCDLCHDLGAIRLNPKTILTSFPGTHEQTLARINRAISNRPFVNPHSPKPPESVLPIGKHPVFGDLPFIKRVCLGNPDAPNQKAIWLSKQSKCSTCHDLDSIRPPIFPPPFTSKYLLKWHVTQGIMPKGKKNGLREELSVQEMSENNQLYSCIEAMTHEAFVRKMTEIKCENANEAPSCSTQERSGFEFPSLNAIDTDAGSATFRLSKPTQFPRYWMKKF